VDIPVGVAYREDIGRVRSLLLELAAQNPNILMEPEPIVIFQGYGSSSIDFTFAVWAKRESFLAVKNEITEEVKRRFDDEGVEIPFPHLSVYTGSVTDPFPIRVVQEDS
jgi:small-conductance mechanosensitive channel